MSKSVLKLTLLGLHNSLLYTSLMQFDTLTYSEVILNFSEYLKLKGKVKVQGQNSIYLST